MGNLAGEGDVRGARGKSEGTILDQLTSTKLISTAKIRLMFTNSLGEEGAADEGPEKKCLEKGWPQ